MDAAPWTRQKRDEASRTFAAVAAGSVHSLHCCCLCCLAVQPLSPTPLPSCPPHALHHLLLRSHSRSLPHPTPHSHSRPCPYYLLLPAWVQWLLFAPRGGWPVWVFVATINMKLPLEFMPSLPWPLQNAGHLCEAAPPSIPTCVANCCRPAS